MASKRRRVSNPLALAVLSALRERPMHPYEMAATMRSQGKERSIKLNYGSLYTVVDNLAKHGLIEAMEATREGRRPERTVYRLTEAGRRGTGGLADRAAGHAGQGVSAVRGGARGDRGPPAGPGARRAEHRV